MKYISKKNGQKFLAKGANRAYYGWLFLLTFLALSVQGFAAGSVDTNIQGVLDSATATFEAVSAILVTVLVFLVGLRFAKFLLRR